MKTTRKPFLYPIIAGLICALDQAIKCGIRRLPEHVAFFTIPGILELTRYTNTGAAFSILTGHTAFLAILSLLLLGVMVVVIPKNTRLCPEVRATLSVLIGAGAGNLLDRILFDGVTDYIRLLWIPFPVFNFADICITASVAVLSYFIITGRLDQHPEETAYGTED